MKYLVKFFVVTSLILICTYASAENKVAYLDLKFILNNSKAGKGAQDYLKKTFNDNQKIFFDFLEMIYVKNPAHFFLPCYYLK